MPNISFAVNFLFLSDSICLLRFFFNLLIIYSSSEEDVEDDEDAAEAEETDLDADVAMAFDTDASPEDRREAFIRAVKAAMKG